MQAFARIQVSASPMQIFGLYSDERFGAASESVQGQKLLEKTGTTALIFQPIPKAIKGMSDRESLVRTVYKKIEGGMVVCHYQVENANMPVAKGAKRIFSEYCIMASREKEGGRGGRRR